MAGLAIELGVAAAKRKWSLVVMEIRETADRSPTGFRMAAFATNLQVPVRTASGPALWRLRAGSRRSGQEEEAQDDWQNRSVSHGTSRSRLGWGTAKSVFIGYRLLMTKTTGLRDSRSAAPFPGPQSSQRFPRGESRARSSPEHFLVQSFGELGFGKTSGIAFYFEGKQACRDAHALSCGSGSPIFYEIEEKFTVHLLLPGRGKRRKPSEPAYRKALACRQSGGMSCDIARTAHARALP